MVPNRGASFGRAILDREVVHIRDIGTDPEVAQFVRDLGIRTAVGVPLLRDGMVIGAISLNAKEPGGLSDSQIELLKTFAEQTLITFASAETYQELQQRTADLEESLKYQTATSDVLKVISRSTFDLQPVLDRLVETAAQLCGADMAFIFQTEGGLTRLIAEFGFPPEYTAWVQSLGPRPPRRGTLTGRTALEARIFHIPDVLADPEFDVPQAVTLGKMRTALGVPLFRDGIVIGTISLARKRVEPFTDRQIELVRTFADQAVIAIENTRLLTETREALEQQIATAEILGVINASPGDLTPVFQTILEKAHALCDVAYGSLQLYDGDFAPLPSTDCRSD